MKIESMEDMMICVVGDLLQSRGDKLAVRSSSRREVEANSKSARGECWRNGYTRLLIRGLFICCFLLRGIFQLLACALKIAMFRYPSDRAG